MKTAYTDLVIIYFSKNHQHKNMAEVHVQWEVKVVNTSLSQEEYVHLLKEVNAEKLILVDGEQISLEAALAFVQQNQQQFDWERIGYLAAIEPKYKWGKIRNLWHADSEIVSSPILVGNKGSFFKAYGGSKLSHHPLVAIGYSLQKVSGLKFQRFQQRRKNEQKLNLSYWKLWSLYTFCIPFHYLISGQFFTQLFQFHGKVQRDIVYRFLFFCFACFAFVFMPYISKDFGVTGDEFVDHRHAGYVLNYFAHGDETALKQPKTALHLYGNSVQVVAAALCRWFEVDNYYELRHVIGGLIGALGVLATGWMGLRLGGGLCGLLSLLLMFFTPRFFGHSMNNLKDIPFAVGYMLAVFYTVRLFDYYPYFRLRHLLGVILGIVLALGTRSGGLVLYPMLLMYAGLIYMFHCGFGNFYKIGKYSKEIGQLLQVLFLIVVVSYCLSILLWPFALEHPYSGVLYSLKEFTRYAIGLRTTFDGEQMMSNMLPWRYAPQYLCIGMPIVVLLGFFLYCFYIFVRKKEFSLIGFFLLFSTIFPVFWVIYCHSNLYGGIRHLLFVMPPMVVLSARFWSEIICWSRGYLKLLPVFIFIGLLYFPVRHFFKNHPNEYVYFNEFVGGLEQVYGDYETDYYFNSLKASADWFRKEILPSLPKDQKTVIVSQATDIINYYFRKDTNIKIIYSRYYEKYAKDWDYALFGNVYISPAQLKNQLFPPVGTLYTPLVDGYPMSVVMKRNSKLDLEGFRLEKEEKYEEAILAFNTYLKECPDNKNEEVYSRLGKLYYLTGEYEKAKKALEQALQMQPVLNEALYILTTIHIKQENFSKALELVNLLLADNSFSVDAWYLKALIFYDTQQYQQAISVVNQILKMRPNDIKALLLAGNIFRDNLDFDQAARIYQQALQIQRRVDIAVLLADVLIRQKQYQQAEILLQQLKGGEESFWPIHKVKCRMYLQQEKLDEAIKILNQLEEQQKDAELFVLRAMYAHLRQDFEKRDQMLKEALILEPKNIEALRMKNNFK